MGKQLQTLIFWAQQSHHKYGITAAMVGYTGPSQVWVCVHPGGPLEPYLSLLKVGY